MGSIPYAFSVHHFITSVGADAGFAAIIGLALLVFLFFAQARETSTLREQAFESAQRVQQLEARLAQLTARPTATGPQATIPPAPAPPGIARQLANRVPSAAADGGTAAPATADGRPIAGSPARPAIPLAPAGVAAPALAAATKLIPTPAAPPLSADLTESEPPGSPVAAPVLGQSVAAQSVAAGSAVAVADPPIGATGVGSLPPATAAGNGGSRGAAPPPAAAGPPPPRAQIKPAGARPGARRPGAPPRPLSPPRSTAPRPVRALLTVVGVLVVAGAIAALLIITSSNGTNVATHSAAANSNAPAPKHHHKAAAPAAPAFNPSSVTVSVLNGTSTSGLAATIAAKLVKAGYKQGMVTNGPNQTQTSTVVAYMNAAARKDALEVASSLKLQPSSVQAIDSSTQAIACPSTSPCTANVVVTVGTDLASTA